MGVKTREHPGIFKRKFKRPDGSVYEGRVWWAQYWKDGKPYQESTKTADLERAIRFRERKLLEIEQGQFVSPRAKQITVKELADDVEKDYTENRRDVETLRYRLRHLRPYFGSRRVADLTPECIHGYIEQRQTEKADNGTINRELGALRRMLHLAQKRRKLATVPPVERIRENGPRTGFFEHEEVLRLLPHLPEDLRAFIAFAEETGWRKGEVSNLTWDRVDLHTSAVRLDVGTTKNQEGRTVYLSDALAGTLAKLKKDRDEQRPEYPFVFHREEGKVRDIRKAWARACKAAKIAPRTCHGCRGTGKQQDRECLTCKGKGTVRPVLHDMRRSAVRNMVRAGIPQTVAMERSGHKTAEVFRRYNITSDADHIEAANRLARYIADRAPEGAPCAIESATTPPQEALISHH